MADRVSIRLSVEGAEATRAFDEVARSGEISVSRIKVALSDLQKSGTSAKVSIEQVDPSLDKLGRSLNALRNRWDETYRTQQQFERAQRTVNRAVEAQLIPMAEGQRLLGLVAAGHRDAARDAEKSAASTGQVRFAVQNLGFQLNDIATSLASGGSPFRVLAQQSGQVVQAVQQGGGVSTVLGAAATAIRSMITPTTAAVAGVAALAGGFALLIARASSNTEQLRQFNLILRGTGRDSLTTANNLQQVVRQLREAGIGRDDATAAVTAIARNPRLNPAQAGRISAIGLDVGARLGLEGTAGIEKFTDAIAGGVEGVLKLGFAMSALSGPEAANIRDMARHGQQAEALRLAIDTVAGKISGDYKKSLTDGREAAQSLSSAWRNLLDNLSDTAPFQSANKALRETLQGFADILAGKGETVLGRGLRDLRELLPDSRAATARAEENRTEMAAALRTRGTPYPIDLSTGGALGRAFSTTANASLEQVDPELMRAFERTLIETGMRAVITSSSGGSHVSGSQHYPWNTTTGLGEALDFNLLDAAGRPIPHSAARQPGSLGYRAYVQFGNAFKRLSQGRGRSGMDFSQLDPGHVDFGRLSGAPAGANASLVLPDQQQMADAETALRKLRETEAAATRTARLWGIEQQASQAYLAEKNRALAEGVTAEEAETRGQIAAAGARERGNIELQKAATVQDALTAALLKSADAFRASEAAGYRAQAEEQARVEVMQRGGDVAQRTRQILEEQAASAIQAAARQLAASRPQLAALDRLAEATQRGTDAARTQDALARAEAARNPGLIAQATALHEAALAEARRAEAARQNIAAFRAANDNRLALRSIQLETGLVGQPPEEIQRRLATLAVEQRLATDFADAGEDARKAYAGTALAIVDARTALAEAQREQERWNDAIRGVASMIENTLTRAIEDALDGRKAESWGQRLKSIFSSLMSQLSSALFIRPAIGTALGALGFGTLAQQYGTFGGLLGGGGAGGGSVTLAPNADGTFSLSNLSSVASLGKTLFGGGGAFGGVGSWLNTTIGQPLGFWGGTPFAANGLFGDLTLTSALGSIGAGLGAGSLLNSLLGGDTMLGTIGSGIGSIAGSLLPAALGFSLGPLGGIAGGLLGGLFGLFGGKPPANETGAFVSLASGVAGDFRSHGQGRDDQNVRQITGAITEFSRSIRQATGGSLSGFINPVSSTRDGLVLNYDIAGFGSGKYKASDVQDAIDKSKLAIARGLQGVTDTIRTVVNTVTDPGNLDAAIQFAATYDRIAEAAKDAFASVPGDLDKTGPFAQAKQQIASIFDEIAANAQKFGLSLDPVNAALAEAGRRLTEDFNRSIADALTAITDPARALVETEKRAGAARIKEAEAVGGNLVEVNRLNAATLDQIWKNQTQSLRGLADELRSGALSGLTPAASVTTANDNFRAVLAAVRGGDLSRSDELGTLGRDVITQAQAAYGNAPRTAGLRRDVLSAIDQVLASRSFAAGTTSTPPGWIRVGERGPEWLYQPGGMAVAPYDAAPRSGGGAELVGEIRALCAALAALLKTGHRIAQAAATETLKRLDAQLASASRTPPAEPPRRRVA